MTSGVSELFPSMPAGPSDDWLDAECRRLLGFGRRIVHPAGGAAWLDDAGAPDLDRPVHTWITSRTVHVYALGALLGVEGCTPIATAALDGLRTTLHDAEHGGWFSAVDAAGVPVATAKSCYDHAFVMLAGSTAVVAGLPGADDLLAEATAGLRGALLGRGRRDWSSTSGTARGPRPRPTAGSTRPCTRSRRCSPWVT